MRKRLPNPDGLRLLRRIPSVLGVLLVMAGLWLLLLVYAMTGMADGDLVGWELLSAAASGEGLLVNLLGLGLIVIGFLVARIRLGDPPRASKSEPKSDPVKISNLKLSGLWRTMRRMMVATATVTCLVAIHWLIVDSHVSEPVYLAVSACVAGLFASGAMRQPWFFLAIAVLLWAALPRVSDSSANDMFVGCYRGGWTLGALAGGIMRVLKKVVAPLPLDPEPPAPS